MKKLKELEQRIKDLEHESGKDDLIACSFEDVIFEPRWKDIEKEKSSKDMDRKGYFIKCDRWKDIELITSPEELKKFE